jgi:hypothetical protein
MARKVRCGEHGDVGAAFVCEHVIATDRPLGFFWTPDEEPCGWCAACEEARLIEGEWNERSEKALGKSRLICTECFARLRAFHYPEADAVPQ